MSDTENPSAVNRLVSMRGKVLLGACILILLGASIFFRFEKPNASVLHADEITNVIAAVKLNTPNQTYDARWYNYEHPFLGKKILGLLLEPRAYYNTTIIPINLFVYNYLGVFEFRDQIERVKWMAALFGILLLIPVFLLGKLLFDWKTGLLAAVLVGLSVGFINLSRIVYQDAILPFFFFFTLYFAFAFIKTPRDKSWKNIRVRDIYFVLTLLFLGLSALVRVGQPFILAMSLLAGLFYTGEKIKKWAVGVVVVSIMVIFFYPFDAFLNLLFLHRSQFFPREVYLNVLVSFISQNSWMVVVLAGALVLFALQKIHKGTFFSTLSHWKKNTLNLHRISFVVTLVGLITAILFVDGDPRLYLVFFLLPLIYLSAFLIQKTGKKIKIIFIGAVIFDLFLLASAAPFFMQYTIGGLQPDYIQDETSYVREAELFMQRMGSRYFTNDARIIADDSHAEAIPPYHDAYSIASICTPDFGANFAGTFLLYNKIAFSFEKTKYLCPYLSGAVRQLKGLSETLKEEFELYEIRK